MKYREPAIKRLVIPAAVAATISVCWAAVAWSCPCHEIPQPDASAAKLDRLAGIKFTETDKYKSEFAAAVEGARAACEKHKGEPNIAVVADIDETILDNRPEFEKHPDYTWPQFDQWIQKSSADTLKPTADFLSWARSQGYAVFLITGRNENQRRATIANLVRDGVSYDGLFMRPDKDHSRAEEMKTQYRKQIEAMGFKIIANIGDQYSDLYGGHSEDCEKLPNRMYYIP